MTGNGEGLGDAEVPTDTGYLEPGLRAPAPAPLRLAQVFVNTVDREAGRDALDTPQHLVEWLAHHGLLAGSESAGDDDLTMALDLREGLRALFLTHHDASEAATGVEAGTEAAAEGLRRLDRALAHLPIRLSATGGGIGAAPWSDSAVRAALTEIAAVLIRADPEQLKRLKACRRDVCRWVFYDSSRNRGGTWCAMDICGARTKMQTYRDRRRSH
jgi:predicted RNA-binding Zn ribbon-like protein